MEPNERSTLLAKHSRAKKYDLTGSVSSMESANDLNGSVTSVPSLMAIGAYEECNGNNAGMGSATSITSSDLDDEFSWRRFRFYLVEPMVFILLFSYNLSETVVKNQIIYQTCTTIYAFNETDCRLLGTKNASEYIKNIETTIQPYAARVFMTSSLIESLVPAFCGVFIGTWSDHFGRKPLLAIAYSGYALYYAIAAIIAQLSTICLVSPWYYLLAVLPLSLVGGSVTYSVATFCYISDVSSAEERPYRMTTYQAALFMGLMSGSFVAGYLYEATNATFVFLTSCCCIFAAVCIIVCCVPESLNRRRICHIFDNNNVNQTAYPMGDNHQVGNVTESSEVKKLFDLAAVKEMLNTCFKPRECNDRAIIWLSMIALLISVFVLEGSMTVFYLFTRQKFHWTIKEFTTFETISMFTSTMGNVIGVIVLKKMLKLSTVNLGILAFLSESVGFFTRAFADTNWVMYLSVGLSALKSIAHPMCRTIASNVLPANELGKFFSFHGVLESFLPLIASPVYTGIYSITLQSFPGFYNLLNANMFLLAIGCLLAISRKKKAFPTHYQQRF